MENGYYQIKKIYVLFFLFFCVFLLTLTYFNYVIDLKIDKIVQVSHELANHMVEFEFTKAIAYRTNGELNPAKRAGVFKGRIGF